MRFFIFEYIFEFFHSFKLFEHSKCMKNLTLEIFEILIVKICQKLSNFKNLLIFEIVKFGKLSYFSN